MNADGAAFLRGDAAKLLGVFHLSCGAKRHGVWEYSCAKQACRQDSLLEISSDQQRQFRFSLQSIQEHDGLIAAVPPEKSSASGRRHGQCPNVISANTVAEVQIFRIVAQLLHTKPNHEELADFLFLGKRG